uniref:Secreted protein n=1 Tax=Anopheles triannulatus TaxID=58253 RepID=A0A2M4AZK0_9DIPT
MTPVLITPPVRGWPRHMLLLPLLLLACLVASVSCAASWRPCADLDALLKIPCRCNIETAGNNSQYVFVNVNCDRTTLTAPFPAGIPIISFSQRNNGHQLMPVGSSFFRRACVRRM